MWNLFKAVIVCAMLALAGTTFTMNSPTLAQGYSSMTCNQLWHARNKFFADAGYCFKTRRGRRAFGAGCFPPYGQLSGYAKQQVETIKYWESRNGC